MTRLGYCSAGSYPQRSTGDVPDTDYITAALGLPVGAQGEQDSAKLIRRRSMRCPRVLPGDGAHVAKQAGYLTGLLSNNPGLSLFTYYYDY